MRRMPRTLCLWPGLAQLWDAGHWRGLALAVGFSLGLNLLLLASLVWVELFSPWQLRTGWTALGLMWVVSAWSTAGRNRRIAPQVATADMLFRQATDHYLVGSYFEAETLLSRVLTQQPGDVEARLLFATLLRRTGRFAAALDQLTRLERFRDGHKWQWETAAERRLIADEQASLTETASPAEFSATPIGDDLRKAA